MNSELKIGIVLFHKNINKIYKKEWIDKCLKSLELNEKNILNPCFYYEIDYGGTNNQIKKDSKFWNIELKNYAEAMNFIISKAFNYCDIVFNVNLDDFYHENRFKEQLETIENQKADIVSSNFYYVSDLSGEDIIIRDMNFTSQTDILKNFIYENNVIAHPAVCYSKRFWEDKNNRYNIELTPAEDFDLWKRAIKAGYKFYICDNHLLYYRIHNTQSSNQ